MAAPIRNTTGIRHKSKPLTSNVAVWRMLRISQEGTQLMSIRLQRNEGECRRAAEAIAATFDVLEISRLYPNRPPGRLVRIYLNTASPTRQRQEEQ